MHATEKFRLLHLEDNPDDSELLRIALDKSHFEYEMVEVKTRKEFESQKISEFDLIVSDYNLQDYDGLSALKWVRSFNELIPVIMLSGTIGEELAADLMQAGASDFILKANVNKISHVIQRVFAKRKADHEKLLYQEQILEKTLLLDTIFDNFSSIIFLKDANSKYVKVNKKFCEFLERNEEEILNRSDIEVLPKGLHDISQEKDELVLLTGRPISYETEHLDSNGNKIVMHVTKTPLTTEGTVTGIIGEVKDITLDKRLMENSKRSQTILNEAERLTSSGSFEYDADLDVLICSANFKNLMKLQVQGNTISLRKLAQLVKEEDRELLLNGLNRAIDDRTEYFQEHRFNIKNDHAEVSHFQVSLKPDYFDDSGKRFYGTIVDITVEYVNHIYLMDKLEEDRMEIARELHDNLGQKLNAISMFTSKICDQQPENKDLDKVREIAHDSIDDLGFLINNISVKQVQEHSLDYAIDKLIDYLPESMKIDKNYNVIEDRLSGKVKSQLYRIIQEVLNNASKYSEASRVKMDMKHEGSILSLLIEDNGKGFELDKVKGNGLNNIKHRVKKSNGLINIHSKKGIGTRVNIKMPVT